MLDTVALSAADLAEMFDRELPCDGVPVVGVLTCDNAARWTISYGHGCPAKAPHKCDTCMTLLRDRIEAVLEQYGQIICCDCDCRFRAVDDFVRYRKI